MFLYTEKMRIVRDLQRKVLQIAERIETIINLQREREREREREKERESSKINITLVCLGL